MEIHHLEYFFQGLEIINNVNLDRIKTLRREILTSNIYLLPYQRNRLIKRIVCFNEIFPKNEDRFHLHETILLNFYNYQFEPRFLFKNTFVSSTHLQKLPKYKKRYILEKFKNTKNIVIHNIDNEVYFEINYVLEITNNKDLLFLKELAVKSKEILFLINEAKNIRRT
ncbi:hypothetical protein [Spiroplasma taiwanense]|uniref:Uncharacterized protein n=1 Tax=Spiroplasma taiwanense CT-1 TaxID=1276220 RepID=S5MBE3_9MOLU|nr:hypothetical protein [Spiroplasma taiwanense]AGR41088.1 hypothetical protein STAIW_v1c04420 [Spiroplasma taiwanense CT-1]